MRHQSLIPVSEIDRTVFFVVLPKGGHVGSGPPRLRRLSRLRSVEVLCHRVPVHLQSHAWHELSDMAHKGALTDVLVLLSDPPSPLVKFESSEFTHFYHDAAAKAYVHHLLIHSLPHLTISSDHLLLCSYISDSFGQIVYAEKDSQCHEFQPVFFLHASKFASNDVSTFVFKCTSYPTHTCTRVHVPSLHQKPP